MINAKRGKVGKAGFTLIELLIVIAIVAILATVVLLVLNPVQMLKRGRDSNRLSDFNSLNTALGVFHADQPSGSVGSASTTYISIPDTSATCANLGLPAAPTGSSYHCVSSSSLRKVDGTGWIPVDLTSVSAGAPMSQLPIDPVNSTSTGLYYTYTPGGSYQLTGSFESQKYIGTMATDGGADPAKYETGTDLALSSFVNGLVGYWSFDSGNNTSAADLSGYGNSLIWHGGSANHYATGHNGRYAAYFGGNSDYLSPTITSGAPGGKFGTGDFTVMFWAKGNGATGAYPSYVTTHTCGCSEASWTAGSNISLNIRIEDVGEGQKSTSGYSMGDGNWHFAAVGRSGTTLFTYVDGSSYGTATDGSTPWNLTGGSGINLGLGSAGGPYASGVSVDELRLYSRALSADEIQAVYQATR